MESQDKKYTFARGLTLGELKHIREQRTGDETHTGMYDATEEIAKKLLRCNGEVIADFDEHDARLLPSAITKLLHDATEGTDYKAFFT